MFLFWRLDCSFFEWKLYDNQTIIFQPWVPYSRRWCSSSTYCIRFMRWIFITSHRSQASVKMYTAWYIGGKVIAINPSATLTSDSVLNIDHLVTMQCFPGKLCVLAFMSITLETYHPPKHWCKPHKQSPSNSTPQWQWPPSRTMFPATPQNLVRDDLRNMIKSLRHWSDP